MSKPTDNGKIILITGINGFIASSLGQLLLRNGYRLRGTSRSQTSYNALLDGPYRPWGAFDEAVKGVHGIFQVASPIDFELCSWSTTVEPAVHGTLELLSSAKACAGSQLQAVVMTSSSAAMVSPAKLVPEGYVFTEADRNSWALPQARELQEHDSVNGPLLYAASKTAADEAMWEFRARNELPFALCSIHPAVVIGPPTYLPSSPASLSATLKPIFNILSGRTDPGPTPIGTQSFVDVRDVAEIHLWAFENPQTTNGERYIACAGFAPLQAMVDIIRQKCSTNDLHIPEGNRGEGYVAGVDFSGLEVPVWWPPHRTQLSGRKVAEAMRFTYRTLEESLIDTVEELRRYLLEAKSEL